MNDEHYPATASQQAINRALGDYVEGSDNADARQAILGFAVLRHASEEQLRVAVPRHVAQVVSPAALLEIQHDNWENEGGAGASADDDGPAVPQLK